MSSSSGERAPFEYSAQKAVDICFSGKLRAMGGDKGYHDVLQCLYKLKPECFQAIGGVHQSADGTESYQSVKLWISKDFYHNIHMYGILRGARFNVQRIVAYTKGKEYTIIMSLPEGSSVYATDKSPW